MKKIFLHLGFQKTGSTSFQNTCKENVDALLAQDFVYPLFNSRQINYKDIDNHSLVFYSMFTKQPAHYHINIHYNVKDYNTLHKEYKNTLTSYFKLEKDIIISAEAISRLELDELLQLRKYLESFNYKIIPIVLIRSPYDYSCSIYQETTRTGYRREIAINKQRKAIENIQEVFPNTKCIPFKSAFKHEHGVISVLFDEIGIDYKDFKIIKSNESAGNILIRAQAQINKYRPRITRAKINPNNFVLHKLSLQLDSAPFKEKFYFTKEEYAKVKEDCDRENTFFKEHLGEEFCDTEIKFSEENNDIVKFCIAIIQNYEHLPEKNILIKYYKLQYFIALFLSKITFAKTRKKYIELKMYYARIIELMSSKNL